MMELTSWLEERKENCLRIMADKPESEKPGWLEDAAYFQAAITQLAAMTAERDALIKDRALLDWWEKNPRLVVASTGYRGAANSWCWLDRTNALAINDAETLREAIESAMATGEEAG